MYHITTEQIEAFLLLAKNCSYRETSNMLFISQPTITKYIQKLEKELGVPLFRRSSKTVELTPAGKHLAEIWLPLFRRFSESIDEIHVSENAFGNELNISLLQGYHSVEYTATLDRAFQEYLSTNHLPPIRLNFGFFSMREQRNALQRHQIDFSFALDFDYDDLRDIENVKYSRVKVFAVLPTDHPLSGRKEISISELKNETFFLLSSAESVSANKVTLSVLQKYLPEAKTSIVPNFSSMVFAMEHYNGVTLGSLRFIPKNKFVEVPVKELQKAGYDESVTWKTDRMTSEKQHFISFINEWIVSE